MKINLKLSLIIIQITLIPVAILVFVATSSYQKEVTSQVVSKLEAIADIQKSRLKNRNEENVNTLNLLAHDSDIVQETDDYNRFPADRTSSVLENSLVGETNLLPGIREVSIANLAGDIIASTNPKSVGLNISSNTYFQKGKNANYTNDFSKNQNNVISLNIAGPIILNNITIGVIIINSDGSNVTSVITDYTGLGKTGETLLTTKDANGNALFLTPIRFDVNAALTRVVLKGETNVPSTHAVNGEEITMLNAVDYNNVPVVAVTRYIPELKWGIVTKISQQEAYSPINNISDLLLFIGVISALTIIVISFSVAKSFTDPIVKLTDIAKKISTGDLSQRITVSSKDEIKTLALAFNKMTSNLQNSYQDLEKKVSDRTQQLTANINELENIKKASLNILEDLNVEKSKLIESNAKDDAILFSIGDGLIAVDEDRRVTIVNRVAENILGVNKKDLIGKEITSLRLEDDQGNFIPLEKRPTTLAFLSGSIIRVVYFLVREDKKRFPISITATPIILNNKVIGLVELIRDVTREYDVDRAKTDFISIASHQLRTPLTAIKWFCELLLSNDTKSLSAEQLDYVKSVSNSNQRMIDLVNSLLNISRIESGRIIIDPKPTNISELVNGIIKELAEEFAKKKQKIKVTIAENLPMINLDPSLMHEVYVNLLRNAIKYSPNDKDIEISVSKKGDDLLSEIKDNGYGIPESNKDRIFTRFFRGENIVKIEPDGTGLGLYLVKAIIDSSKGKIWFDSTEGKGTTFSFTIPISGMKKQAGSVTLS